MDSLYRKAEHYGNLTGTNKFKRSRLGVVIGSPHYGDKYLQQWGALVGERVERTGSGMSLDYGEYGNQILQTMREGEVLQALMRFGRDGEGATIYVITGALPQWVQKHVLAGSAKLKKWADGMNQVLAAIGDREQFRTADLLVSAGESRVLRTEDSDPISERQVSRHLTVLYEHGFLDREKQGTGWLWQNTGVDRVNRDMNLVRTRTDAE
jgi:DNA-binding transcriptional ArsR family regulator